MDELDKKLFHDLKLDTQVPVKFREIIKKSLYNEQKIKKVHFNSIIRIIVTICSSLALTSGIVYAGTKIYETIWKEPEKVVGYYSEKNNDEQIIYNENVISENKAKELAIELLRKFEHGNETIDFVKLEGNPNNYELLWYIKTNANTCILIDAKNPNSYSLTFDYIINERINKFEIANMEVEKTARALCEKYGYKTEEYTYFKLNSNIELENKQHVVNMAFLKQYDGITNAYEKISIGFIPETSNIISFTVADTKCENNSVQVTSEKAKQIAFAQEEKIKTEYAIKNVEVEQAIVATNGDAFLRAKDYKQYREQSIAQYPAEKVVEYRTDRRIRKVWAVTVNYDIQERYIHSENFVSCDEHYTYFIDATTGEIVGGDNEFKTTKNLLY